MSSGEGRSGSQGRRTLLVVAGTGLALIVLIVVTTARSTTILHSPDRDPNLHIHHGTFTPPTIPGATAGPSGARAANTHEAMVFGTVLLDILLGLALLGLLSFLAAAIAAAVRRWQERRRVIREGPLPDVDDAVLDSVARATRRQEQQLHEGTPSNAIIACWVDLEHAVAAAGVERRPSETSAELTIRVLDALDVDGRSLRTLGALYREARYSGHPLTESQRTTALDALRTLGRSLPVAQERV